MSKPLHQMPPCSECARRGTAIKRRKLDERMHDDFRLLCRDCGAKLGYRPVEFERAGVNYNTTSGGVR